MNNRFGMDYAAPGYLGNLGSGYADPGFMLDSEFGNARRSNFLLDLPSQFASIFANYLKASGENVSTFLKNEKKLTEISDPKELIEWMFSQPDYLFELARSLGVSTVGTAQNIFESVMDKLVSETRKLENEDIETMHLFGSSRRRR